MSLSANLTVKVDAFSARVICTVHNKVTAEIDPREFNHRDREAHLKLMMDNPCRLCNPDAAEGVARKERIKARKDFLLKPLRSRVRLWERGKQ